MPTLVSVNNQMSKFLITDNVPDKTNTNLKISTNNHPNLIGTPQQPLHGNLLKELGLDSTNLEIGLIT